MGRCRLAGIHKIMGVGLCAGFTLWAGLAAAQISIDEYPATSGTYTGGFEGSFTASVTQGDRGGGRLGGGASYSYQFDVPSRPPLTRAQCQNNTPVTGPNDCNRSCIKKDSYKRYLTGVLTGVPAIGVTPSCQAPISGTLQNITLSEAYDTCEAANAWGATTASTVRTLVGPLFHFNNPRTQKTTTGGLFSRVTEWTYSNEAEVLLPYVAIPIRVEITCLPKITRLQENAPERLDAGRANKPSERAKDKPTVDVVVPVAPDNTASRGTKKKKPRKKIDVLKAKIKSKIKDKAKAAKKKLKNQ